LAVKKNHSQVTTYFGTVILQSFPGATDYFEIMFSGLTIPSHSIVARVEYFVHASNLA
jgi:hypothetical protein